MIQKLIDTLEEFTKNPRRPIMFTNQEKAVPSIQKGKYQRNKTIRKKEESITLAREETRLFMKRKEEEEPTQETKRRRIETCLLKEKEERELALLRWLDRRGKAIAKIEISLS